MFQVAPSQLTKSKGLKIEGGTQERRNMNLGCEDATSQPQIDSGRCCVYAENWRIGVATVLNVTEGPRDERWMKLPKEAKVDKINKKNKWVTYVLLPCS